MAMMWAEHLFPLNKGDDHILNLLGIDYLWV